MPPDTGADTRPVTAYDAANVLERSPTTIHVWALRYNVVQLGKIGRRVFYDFNDLAVIEREIGHGHPVPGTPEERAAIRARCPHAANRAA